MNLNAGQQLGVDEFFQFLLNPNEKEFRLSGGAGVGKTYTIQHILSKTLVEYENACHMLNMPVTITGVDLTATTNKAAEVLHKQTGFPTSTIHSYLALKVQDDWSTGKQKIVKTKSWDIKSMRLIVIDEASMIDWELYKLIHEGTDKYCKIVYVGDHCQMAPVMETLSKVYQTNGPFVHLTEPVRNAGQPALMALCKQLRDTVETGVFWPIQAVPGVIEYIDETQFYDLMEKHFIDESTNARILCYTNNRVQQYNEHIRDLRGYPAEFVQGEILVSNSAMNLGPKMLKVEEEIIVTNNPLKLLDIAIDEDDPTVILRCYELWIQTGSGAEYSVRVPLDREHYNALVKHYAAVGRRTKRWSIYFALKNGYPDLRQKDASTVYKAQGSTYDVVFMDLNDIGTCRQADQAARMLYVAGSRPTTKLYLYGRLPEKYGGI